VWTLGAPARIGLAGMTLLVSLSACAGLGRATPPPAVPSAPASLATPYAAEPAAGICAEAPETVAVVTLRPDVPDPRCLIVHPGQQLKIVNADDASRQVVLGRFTFELDPAGSHLISDSLGTYLAPGVHVLLASPCCGPEIWLKPE
jgi:hypothetical protein